VALLILAVDKAMKAFHLETYYDDPKPHVTVASCVGDISSEVSDMAIDVKEYKTIKVRVNEVMVKVGKRIYKLPLKKVS
jgi:hypothetical protein